MPEIKGALTIKSQKDLQKMILGGKKLAEIKKELESLVQEGVSAWKIEEKACQLIEKEGGKSSFKMVPGYRWATCVNKNSGMVHGIPSKNVIFQKGDLVSVDIGLYYQGFHTDTSFSKAINPDSETKHFLDIGKKALKRAIAQVKPKARIFDISKAIEEEIKKGGFTPIRALVGHGVGRLLHEEPPIPCFTEGQSRTKSPELKSGMTLAIEVMYTQGAPDLVLEKDGWTISTRDGKISALFEETVAVTETGFLVLTN